MKNQNMTKLKEIMAEEPAHSVLAIMTSLLDEKAETSPADQAWAHRAARTVFRTAMDVKQIQTEFLDTPIKE